ncbi:DnaB-like helicase N-terminal domain-containing protein [Streptomyces celluloflavus]|uniref:DnaB-like helicase N-terminal domain-containing protein n=1 Tax=Streptomyces celluloflavus TaxID=58344 RepID=UPI0036920063
MPTPGSASDRALFTATNDLEAEQAVVGSLMPASDVIGEVSALWGPADCYRPAHETIHRAVLDLHFQCEPPSSTTCSPPALARTHSPLPAAEALGPHRTPPTG